MKRDKPNPDANKNIIRFAYGFVILFLAMAVYLGYFLFVKKEDVISSPYNPRLDSFAERVIRGQIKSSDGTILARTTLDENGGEHREYPYGDQFAHVVGFSSHGKAGAESIANFYLLSSHVNLVEKVIKELSDRKNIGDNVITSLDLNLQKTAYEALGGRKGAIIAMEPDTGRILCMVSSPSFDPNRIDSDWDAMVNQDDGEARLYNRATQGLYPPGSTFKMITALEYIREYPDSWQNFSFDCDGIYEYADQKIQCYHQEAHGTVDLNQAFAHSCNGAFSELFLSLDQKKFRATLDQLLFDKNLPLSGPFNKSVYTLPDAPEDWELLQTSIGQGKTLMTPMHNALLISAVANGGVMMRPRLMDRVENAGGDVIKKFLPVSAGAVMTAQESAALTNMMKLVVTEGTASALKRDSYQAAGKTGSAEFEAGKETHSWFVGFAPAEDPKIAVSILVEEAGTGGKVAAPIAGKLFDQYLNP